ncbi:MAG: YbaK/EbsC family protein [Pseudomonadota bacterium]
MAIAKTIKAFMEEKGVPYTLLTHPVTYSSRDTAAAAHVYEDHIAKAVILNHGDRYVMAVIPGNSWVKLDAVRDELGDEFEITDEKTVENLFNDCIPGAVPPLGPAYGMETLVDAALASLANVYFESGDHQQLVRIAGEDFRLLLGGSRHGHFSTNS